MSATTTGCPCVLRGFDGEDEGMPLQLQTQLTFEWLHVQTSTGEPYKVQVRYDNLLHRARPIPNCPIRLLGRPGFRYSLDFMDTVADNVCKGMQFCGLMYEGPVLEHDRALPNGGIDILDVPLYWLFPNGELRCCSARKLKAAGEAVGHVRDSTADYEATGEAFGYQFLGVVRNDLADLLENPGTLQERRWAKLRWQLPETAISACWWLTNVLPDGAPSEQLALPPKFLCKSLSVLRAELHQNHVATMAKIRHERHRRRKINEDTMKLLKANLAWRKDAGVLQHAALGSLSSQNLRVLLHWAASLIATSSRDTSKESAGRSSTDHAKLPRIAHARNVCTQKVIRATRQKVNAYIPTYIQ